MSSATTNVKQPRATKKSTTAVITAQPPATTARTRDTAKKNEDADVKLIVAAIHNKTPQGLRLIEGFHKAFNKVLLDAAQPVKAGGRGTHYDFMINVEGEGWRQVEHKGGRLFKPIDPAQPPWIQGVQFYNGTGNQYALGRRYAEEWHAKYIASGHLSQKHNLKAPIPDLQTWLTHDAFKQGNPTTPFGVELRARFRPGKGGCFDERDAMKVSFKIDPTDLETIQAEVLSLAKQVLSEKHYWLQIQGDLNGEFNFAWHSSIQVSKITGVTLQQDKSDVVILFETDTLPITAMLRWGKGQGLSNIRIDLR